MSKSLHNLNLNGTTFRSFKSGATVPLSVKKIDSLLALERERRVHLHGVGQAQLGNQAQARSFPHRPAPWPALFRLAVRLLLARTQRQGQPGFLCNN
jgi:hypothetical protein